MQGQDPLDGDKASAGTNMNDTTEGRRTLKRDQSLMGTVREELDKLEFSVPGVDSSRTLVTAYDNDTENVSKHAELQSPGNGLSSTSYAATFSKWKGGNNSKEPSYGIPQEQSWNADDCKEEKEDENDHAGVKQTCGRNVKVSFVWIVSGYNVVLVLIMGIVLIVSQIRNVDEMNAFCQDNVESLNEGSIDSILDIAQLTAESLTGSLLTDVGLNMTLSVLKEPQDLVESVVEYYLLQRKTMNPNFDGRFSDNPWNASILPKLYLSINETMVYADIVYVAYMNAEFLGINILGREENITLRRVAAPSSTNESLLESCVVIDPIWGEQVSECEPVLNYTPIERPFFTPQIELLEQSAGRPLVATWSEFYVFLAQNISDNIRSAVGISFTYPLSTSTVYDDEMQGVISADITFDSLSEFCNRSIQQAVEALGNVNSTNPDNFLLFAVFSDGTLVASSDPVDYNSNQTNISLVQASDSQNGIIANLSSFIDYSVPANDTQFFGYKLGNGSCPGINQFSDIVTEGIVQPGLISDCLYVAYAEVESVPFGRIRHNSSLKFTTVIVLPYSALFSDLLERLSEAQLQSMEDLKKENQSLKNEIVRNSLVLVIMVVLLGIGAGFLVAILFTKSLRKLAKSMRRLGDLKFQKNYKYYSRIKEINTLQQSFYTLRASILVFSKFVPTTVVQNIVTNESKARQLHVEKKKVTILFSDIKGFTSISEALEKEDLLRLLSTYLTLMSRTVESYSGVVGEILGDGILAFWNTPDNVDSHAAKAVASALAQQRSLEFVNKQFKGMLEANGLEPLSIRIGIHTGEVLTGIFGSKNKFKFGCMGDAVNLASRLEGVCKLYGVDIICSGSTLAELPERNFEVRELDLVQVKGKSSDTKLYEVLGMTQKISEQRPALFSNGITASSEQFSSGFSNRKSFWSWKSREDKGQGKELSSDESTWGPVSFFEQKQLCSRDMYEDALHCFQNGSMEQAKAILENVKEKFGSDTATDLLLQRVIAAMEKGPEHYQADNWTGVLKLSDKEF